MSLLMVKTPNGNLRRVELSKNQPLTIGSHAISDIQIQEPGIELMEARISWGKQHFEVTAATPKGVRLNGETVMAADLKPGDVLSLGNTDLIFTTAELLDQSLGALQRPVESDPFNTDSETDIGLAPISEEIPVREKSAQKSSRPESPPGTPASSASGYQAPAEHKPSPAPPKTVKPPAPQPSSLELETFPDEEWEVMDDDQPETVLSQPETSTQSASDEVSPINKIRESLHAARQRPGEKEIIRSPLVMGLSIGSFFLLVGAVILWSVIGQEKANRCLEQAREQAGQRKFQLAIENYQKYLTEYARGSSAATALRELSATRVRSHIDIGVPDWKAGLGELEDMVNLHRDEADFEQLHETISRFAEQVAKGACDQAGRDRELEYFDVSEEALKFVELYTDDKDRRLQVLEEVQTARRAAEKKIKKADDFDAALAQMESALKQSQPFELLDARLDLIRLHDDAAADPKVAKLLQQALELEKSLVQQQREEVSARDVPPVVNSPVITLSENAPFPSENVSSGRPVYVHGADCLYGLDTETGEPLWRQVVGWNLPFFPLEVDLGEPSLLISAEGDRELWLLSRTTGQVIWKQSLPGAIVGTPLIDGAQAYVSTTGGTLQQIDLTKGTVQAGLTISQPLATGPLLLPKSRHALIIGERELAYLMELNPPAIVDVLHFGHGPGSVESSSVVTTPIRMGPLVLVTENDQSNSCRLRVFDTRQEAPELVQIDEQRLPGHIIDPPVIRGNQLLVPTTPERVTAFTVSAEPDQPSLSQISYYQVPNPRLTSTWLQAGPDDQIWMASSAVRRMHLTTESIEASSELAAVGIATQPMQMLGEWIYVGRRPDYGHAVRVSRLNRNDFSDDARTWRTTLGDGILQAKVNSAQELITLHDSGAIFRLQPSRVTGSPFQLAANANVELPNSLQAARFSALLSDGRFALVWGGPEPTLSVVRPTGQLDPDYRKFRLPDEPRTAPVDLDAGIVVSLPGRLHLVARDRRAEVLEFLLPVEEGRTANWRSLTRIDGTHLLCLDDAGLLRRIEFRSEPPQLAEAGTFRPETRPVLPPLVANRERMLVATEKQQLLSIATDSLNLLSSRSLDSLPTGAWSTEESIFLQLQNDSLLCLKDDEEFTDRWRVDLAGQTVAGRPLVQNEIVFVPVAPDGVWVIKKESGEILRKVKTPGTCSGDPLLFGERVVVPLADGSLYFLPEDQGGDQL